MASKEFIKLIERLSKRVVDAADTFQPNQRNEQWTKANFIVPLLEELGWDRYNDLGFEDSPQDVEGSLDYILRCQPSIGIEAKALHVKPPEDRKHPQITKGLKQSRERKASYFIWTNGDCWQFFSLALPEATIYSITLSNAQDNHEHIAREFDFIEKESFTTNPKLFDEAIREKWKIAALPAALDELLQERTQDVLQLVRGVLPSELEVKDDEILSFFRALKPPSASAGHAQKRKRQNQKSLSFPEDWQELLTSYDDKYMGARKRFQKDYYRKLAQYLISDQYKTWSKKSTWRHAGTSNDSNDKKKFGPVITLFREWHFIEVAEGEGMYKRVEESVPYLRAWDKIS